MKPDTLREAPTLRQTNLLPPMDEEDDEGFIARVLNDDEPTVLLLAVILVAFAAGYFLASVLRAWGMP